MAAATNGDSGACEEPASRATTGSRFSVRRWRAGWFVAPHEPIDRSLAKVLLALLPVSFVLLRFGEPYGLTDLVGVIIVGGLWFLLPRVLKPWIVVRDLIDHAVMR